MLDYQEALAKYGYARIPGYLEKSDIDRLRSESLMALTRLPASDPQRLQVRNGFPALLFWPNSLSSHMAKLSAALAPVVRAVLGDNVLQLNNQYYYRLPGDGDQFAWHQDVAFRIPREKFLRIEERYLQTAIIVDPMSSENGGIEFIPGSHLWGELKNMVPRDGTERGLREFNRGHLAGVTAVAEPGDLMLWSVMVVHGSQPNASNRPRSYLMNGFAAAEAVVDLDFPWYLKHGRLT